MNDQDDLKALDEAWPVPAPPSPSARAAARAALIDRMTVASTAAPAPEVETPARPARRGRRRWTFGLVAVGAAAAAVAAFAAVPSSGHRSGGGVQLVSANTVLDRAALAAERRPFQAPRPDQWVMTEEQGVKDEVTLTRGKSDLLNTTRTWLKADGTQQAIWDSSSKKLRIHRFPTGQGPMGLMGWSYDKVAELPADPDALIALAGKRPPGAHDLAPKVRWGVVLGYLYGILESTPPPALQSAIYKALKKVPGARVTAMKDPVGRPALLLNWDFGGLVRNELLLDPSTYSYLGSRGVAQKPLTRHRDTGTVVLPAGTVISASVRTRAGVVDKPGQLPR
ncbi:CU044_5270 family protein [Spirillospora sp. NPDC052269]